MPPASPADEPALLHVGRVPAMVTRAALLIGEVVVVPGALLYALVSAGHPMAGIFAVFVWRTACIAGRLALRVRVPATCWLAFGLFMARTAAGLAVASVSLYLFVPVVLCAAQGVFFVGTAFARRPVMMRLAADFAPGVSKRLGLRRLFAELSTIWGVAHVLCAGFGAWALTLPDAQAVAVTSVLGVGCTVGSVGACAAWGLWRVARIPGLRIVCAHSPVHPAVPGPLPVPAAA